MEDREVVDWEKRKCQQGRERQLGERLINDHGVSTLDRKDEVRGGCHHETPEIWPGGTRKMQGKNQSWSFLGKDTARGRGSKWSPRRVFLQFSATSPVRSLPRDAQSPQNLLGGQHEDCNGEKNWGEGSEGTKGNEGEEFSPGQKGFFY